MKKKIDIIVTSKNDMLLNDFPYMKHLINRQDLLPTDIRLATDDNGRTYKAIALLDDNSEVSEVKLYNGDTEVSFNVDDQIITTFKTAEMYHSYYEEKKH